MDKSNSDKININIKKKQIAIKSINNYLSQLKLHYELEDSEIANVLKLIILQYQESSNSKKWWEFFK